MRYCFDISDQSLEFDLAEIQRIGYDGTRGKRTGFLRNFAWL